MPDQTQQFSFKVLTINIHKGALLQIVGGDKLIIPFC